MEDKPTTNNLQRFVAAQEGGCRWSDDDGTYEDALSEVRNGRKTGHWIWYIFPQMKGLGETAASDYYGIVDREEAKAYIEHPILGPRLIEISKHILLQARRLIGSLELMPLRFEAVCCCSLRYPTIPSSRRYAGGTVGCCNSK